MLLFKCKINQVKEIKKMTSNFNSYKNFKPVPYTREEIEANAQYEREEAIRDEEFEAEMADHQALLSWTAGNGSEIKIEYGSRTGFYDVAIDGEWKRDCVMVPAPSAYQAKGIVAMIGKVGLTAERQSVLEA